MKFFKVLTLAAFSLLASGLAAGEMLAINGDFNGAPIPEGWNQNRPNNWDSAGTFKVSKVEELEKNSVLLGSKTKKMHLYTKKGFKVANGDSVVLKAMVKGKGTGRMGTYCYPQGTLNAQGFKLKEEWQEVSVTINITSSKITEVRFLIAADAGSTVEYVNLTAEHNKKK